MWPTHRSQHGVLAPHCCLAAVLRAHVTIVPSVSTAFSAPQARAPSLQLGSLPTPSSMPINPTSSLCIPLWCLECCFYPWHHLLPESLTSTGGEHSLPPMGRFSGGWSEFCRPDTFG